MSAGSLLTGYIPPEQRTQEQADLDQQIKSTMPRMLIPYKGLAKGERVRLTDSWAHPLVVADVGYVFDRFVQLTGSCFIPGTKVRMSDGTDKNIEDVKVGDKVISHTGAIRSVVKVFSRSYTGTLYTFRAYSWNREITMTHDHDCLVVETTSDPKGEPVFSRYVKKKAEDVRMGERFLLPFSEDHVVVKTPHGHSGPVLSITNTRVYSTPVYCCEVEEEHSLIVNGIAQHQCVGVGEGNAVFSLSGTQRLLSQNPTKAFVPWWPYPYGRSRFYAGMLRPGSGSFGSAMAKALITDGVFDDKQPGLPAFSRTDGLQLTEALELQWSDGDSSLVEGWLETGRKYPVGAATEVRDTSGLETGIINGYPATFASNYYPGSGQIMGSGENACLVGKFDTYGPHQVSIHNVWNNPDLGLLFWMQNSWPKSVYPRDPAGGPVCGLWVREKDMQAAFGYSAECFLLSHLNWFPAQPEVLNYFV